MAKGGSGSGRRGGGGGRGLSISNQSRIASAIREENALQAARDMRNYGFVNPITQRNPDDDVLRLNNAIRAGLIGLPEDFSSWSNREISNATLNALIRVEKMRINAGLADLGRRLADNDPSAIRTVQLNARRG